MIWLVFIAIGLPNYPSGYSGPGEQILDLDADARAEECAERVLAVLQRPPGFVVDFDLRIREIEPISYYMERSGPSGEEEKIKMGGTRSSTVRGVFSRERCFAEHFRQKDRVITTFDDSRTADYMFRSGRVSFVTTDCRAPLAPIVYLQLGEILNCTPFRFNDRLLSADNLCERIREADWFGSRTLNEESVFVFRQNLVRQNESPFWERYAEYLIGDVQGQMAILGGSTVSSSKVNNPKLGECIETYRDTWDCKYSLLDGSFLFPKRFHQLKVRDYSSLEGNMIAGPYRVRECSLSVVNVKRRESFPQEVFKIEVPPTAIIEDLCQEQKIVAEEMQDNASFPFSLVFAGLLVSSAVGWWGMVLTGKERRRPRFSPGLLLERSRLRKRSIGFLPALFRPVLPSLRRQAGH